MAQRCIWSSWTGSLTPSSIDLQTSCTLWVLISTNFPSSPFPPFLTTTFDFNELPLEGQPSQWYTLDAMWPFPGLLLVQVYLFLFGFISNKSREEIKSSKLYLEGYWTKLTALFSLWWRVILESPAIMRQVFVLKFWRPRSEFQQWSFSWELFGIYTFITVKVSLDAIEEREMCNQWRVNWLLTSWKRQEFQSLHKPPNAPREPTINPLLVFQNFLL